MTEDILIINPFGIGDVLFTTPLVRAIRRAFPDCYLGYLCNRRTEPVLCNNPNINSLFVYEKDDLVGLWQWSLWEGAKYLLALFKQIRKHRWSLVVDLSLGERYSFLLRCFGVRRLIGFNYRSRGRFLSESISIDGYQDDHVVGHYQRLLRFMGIHMREHSLELVQVNDDRLWVARWLAEQGLEQAPLLVGLVPAGGVSWGKGAHFRRWSYGGFAAVGDALIERWGAKVVLLGEQTDREACSAVARLMRHPAVDLSGQTTLNRFVGFLSRLDLVICNDGGPLHLAVSCRTPTVSIFGPVDPNVYGPYGPDLAQRHRVVCQKALPCRPCYHQFRLPPCPYERACLTSIAQEDVIAACNDLLSHKREKSQK